MVHRLEMSFMKNDWGYKRITYLHLTFYYPLLCIQYIECHLHYFHNYSMYFHKRCMESHYPFNSKMVYKRRLNFWLVDFNLEDKLYNFHHHWDYNIHKVQHKINIIIHRVADNIQQHNYNKMLEEWHMTHKDSNSFNKFHQNLHKIRKHNHMYYHLILSQLHMLCTYRFTTRIGNKERSKVNIQDLFQSNHLSISIFWQDLWMWMVYINHNPTHPLNMKHNKKYKLNILNTRHQKILFDKDKF